MPRLIHLNGPPGIGKSTLSAMYAERHPGVLNLDIDRLRPLVGGWRERFAETGHTVRPLALAMARTHLAADRDVVLPQYLGLTGEVERFERVAHETGSEFREIVLMDERTRSVERFYARTTATDDPWQAEVVRIVEADGGAAALEAMYDRLRDVVDARPDAAVVNSRPAEIDATYDAVIGALAAPRA